MELRQLRYFVKMVDLGNMTRAASELHVAQPALSQQLANLEAGLGVKLLDRSLKGVSPTHAGSLFYKHAKAILRKVDESQLAMRAESESPSGQITVAMPSSSARLITIPLIRLLVVDYPAIQLKLVEAPSAGIPALLSRGEVDIAIAADLAPTRLFKFQPLLSEELFAVFPAAQHGASSMTLTELSRFPLILPSQFNGIRSRLDAVFAKRKLTYKLVAEINVTSLLALAVREGLGASVLPWSAVHEYAQAGQLRVVTITRPSIKRNLQLCMTEDVSSSAAAALVLLAIKQVCGELTRSGEWRGSRWEMH